MRGYGVRDPRSIFTGRGTALHTPAHSTTTPLLIANKLSSSWKIIIEAAHDIRGGQTGGAHSEGFCAPD